MISVDWSNKIIESTASILDLLVFHATLRDLEDDPAGAIHPVTHTWKALDLGGAYFYQADLTNGYTLKFIGAGPFAIVGNLNGAIVNTGVQIERKTSAAFVTSIGSVVDQEVTGWAASNGGTDLYAMIDEPIPDNTDYIYSGTVGQLYSIAMPAGCTSFSLRASSATGNGLSVTIKDGATTIATRSLTLTPTYDLHTITLTSGEIAAITSGNLTVEMTSI